MTLSQRAIEAAARAIYESKLFQPARSDDPWDGKPTVTKTFCRQAAQSAITAALAVDGLCLVDVAMLRDMHEALEQTDDWHIPDTENWTLYHQISALIAAANDGEERR